MSEIDSSVDAVEIVESMPSSDRVSSRRRRRLPSDPSSRSQDIIIVDSLDEVGTARARRRRRRDRPTNSHVTGQPDLVDLTCLPNESSVTVDLVDLTSSQERTPLDLRSFQRRTSPALIPLPTESNRNNAVSRTPTIGSTNNSSSRSVLVLTCPVCLEPVPKLMEKGLQMRSTICGHIFCQPCIVSAIRSNRKCPTCRKKLTERQTHPIYF